MRIYPRRAFDRFPVLRRTADAVVPSRRRIRDQWRRIDFAVAVDRVQSGPFEGMRLFANTTGSHIPKRLGSYESELHDLIRSWHRYDRIIDVGCGEGWYVVGLSRRMPDAEVWGFDSSPAAQKACRAAASRNKCTVSVGGEVTAGRLGELVCGRTLLIVDAEGAEVDVLDPSEAPGLYKADILVEMHDFLRPGASAVILSRFPGRNPTIYRQEERCPASYPRLSTLAAPDQDRALSESRDPSQVWLWLPAKE